MNHIKKANSVIKESKSLSKLIEADINSKSIWMECDNVLYDAKKKLEALLPDQEQNEDLYNRLKLVIQKVDEAQGVIPINEL